MLDELLRQERDHAAGGPRALKSAECRHRREQLLQAPHIAPLTKFAESLKNRNPSQRVAWFDPLDGGVNARILVLMKYPGGKSATADGSGFVSSDNDDVGAQRVWEAIRTSGVSRDTLVLWNVVPWNTDRDNASRNDELLRGANHLGRLLAMLPGLRGVLLSGRDAERGWAKARHPATGIKVATCFNPSARSGADLVISSIKSGLLQLHQAVAG